MPYIHVVNSGDVKVYTYKLISFTKNYTYLHRFIREKREHKICVKKKREANSSFHRHEVAAAISYRRHDQRRSQAFQSFFAHWRSWIFHLSYLELGKNIQKEILSASMRDTRYNDIKTAFHINHHCILSWKWFIFIIFIFIKPHLQSYLNFDAYAG